MHKLLNIILGNQFIYIVFTSSTYIKSLNSLDIMFNHSVLLLLSKTCFHDLTTSASPPPVKVSLTRLPWLPG